MDPHRFICILLSILMPIRIQILLIFWCRSGSGAFSKFIHVEKVRSLLKHYLELFYFSLQRHSCHNFWHFDSILNFLEKIQFSFTFGSGSSTLVACGHWNWNNVSLFTFTRVKDTRTIIPLSGTDLASYRDQVWYRYHSRSLGVVF